MRRNAEHGGGGPYAREQARKADQMLQEGNASGPLHGVPVGVKDIFDTKDMPTEDVTVHLYEDGRHEVLNDSNRDEVIADLAAWVERDDRAAAASTEDQAQEALQEVHRSGGFAEAGQRPLPLACERRVIDERPGRRECLHFVIASWRPDPGDRAGRRPTRRHGGQRPSPP